MRSDDVSKDLTAEIVYVSRVKLVPGLLAIAAALTFMAYAAFDAFAHFRASVSEFVALLLLAIGLFLGALLLYGAFLVLRQLAKPLPLLRLDTDGLECAAGRIFWTSVERISLARYEKESGEGGRYLEDWFWLVLRPGVEPMPPSSSYMGSTRARQVVNGLEIAPWTRKERVAEMFRRFYGGPVSIVPEWRTTTRLQARREQAARALYELHRSRERRR